MARADALASMPLSVLADLLGRRLPRDTTRDKGFVGTLVEQALGATAENRSVPDFERLGVELKTVPVQAERPKESTFVCTATPREAETRSWADSALHHKTRRILWVPVEADPQLPLGVRRLGAPLLWSPSAEQDQQIEEDWTQLAKGSWQQLSAREGVLVQLRPKAAHGRIRRADDEVPRAWYFRRRFVMALFEAAFLEHSPEP
ncbi:MAG: MutH/Sau3AI family endonuclease [Myxococcota bacterium]